MKSKLVVDKNIKTKRKRKVFLFWINTLKNEIPCSNLVNNINLEVKEVNHYQNQVQLIKLSIIKTIQIRK